MADAQLKVSESRAYWTHQVDGYPGPVAVTRMAMLIDFDPRVTETGRIVYRFLISWYHRDHGDALLSQRHVAKVMKQRAPDVAAVPSRSAVSRAIINLIETGWVARTVRGRGRNKSASRYVPTFNVLELAEMGRFPEPAQQVGQFETGDKRPTGRASSEETGPVERAASIKTGPLVGPKTPIRDPRTLDSRGSSMGNSVAANGGPAADAPAAVSGFERIWRAYGKHGNKQASRESFSAIAEPDVDHITERAAAWAASAKPGQRRMPFEKWLAAEKYDEADRLTNKPRTIPTAANDNHDEDNDVKISQKIPSPPRRIGTRIGKIAAAREESSPDGNLLVLTFEEGGTRSFFAEAADNEKQEAGQRELAMLSEIAGLLEVEDAAQLEGLKFSLTEFDDGSARWEAA